MAAVGSAPARGQAEATIASAQIISAHTVAASEPLLVRVRLAPVRSTSAGHGLDAWLNTVLPLGAPGTRRTTIVYEIELYRVGATPGALLPFGDTRLGTWRIERWAEPSGALGASWRVYFQEGDSVAVTASTVQAQGWMTTLWNVPLDGTSLPAGIGTYYVSVRASRHSLLPGASFETPWLRSAALRITVIPVTRRGRPVEPSAQGAPPLSELSPDAPNYLAQLTAAWNRLSDNVVLAKADAIHDCDHLGRDDPRRGPACAMAETMLEAERAIDDFRRWLRAQDSADANRREVDARSRALVARIIAMIGATPKPRLPVERRRPRRCKPRST